MPHALREPRICHGGSVSGPQGSSAFPLRRAGPIFAGNPPIQDLPLVTQTTDFPRMIDPPSKGREDVDLATRTKPKTQRPPLYKVLLLNDDFTPMEFVVHILERLFGMTHAQAIEIMLTVHRKGVAVVGVFSHEIAETKVAQVMELARRQQHPLQCTMEKE